MKYLITILLFTVNHIAFSQVGIGITTPASSAQLDITSTTRGLLPPRMATSQRDAIVSPVAGLVIFNTTTGQLEIYNGTSWNSINSLIAANSPVKRLYGTNAAEFVNDLKATPDGGFIFVGSTPGFNNGSLMGISSNGNSDCWVVKLDAKGSIDWQKLYGSNAADGGLSVINTTDGGYAVTGYASAANGSFNGTVYNGQTDVFILKLDASGNIQWKKLYGGSFSDIGYSIGQTTSDGGYVISGISNSSNTGTLSSITGNGNNDFYIIKTDASGNILWQKLYGGAHDDQSYCIQVCNDGSLVCFGYAASSNTGNLIGVTNNGAAGTKDAFILKLTSAGALSWQKLLGGSGEEIGFYISQTADNGFIFAAASNSPNNGTLTGTINNGSHDGWMVRTDGNGNLLWQKLLGGLYGEYPYFVKETPDNGFLVTGTSASSNSGTIPYTNNGSADAWVIRLDASGNTMWQRLYGGSLDENNSTTAAILPDGSIMLGSSSTSSNSGTLAGIMGYGSNDAWIFKIDKYGNPF